MPLAKARTWLSSGVMAVTCRAPSPEATVPCCTFRANSNAPERVETTIAKVWGTSAKH